MKLSDVENWFIYKHKIAISSVFVVLILILFAFWQLGSLTGGIADVESLSGLANSNLDNFINNPLNALHQFLQWISVTLFGGTALAARLPAVILGIITLASTFALLKIWNNLSIAVFGVLFFGTSSWFLHVSRLGVEYMILPALLTLLILTLAWFHHSDKKVLPLVSVILATSLALYSPFFIYLAILVFALYYRQIMEIVRSYKVWQKLLIALGFLVLLSPLIWSMTQDSDVLRIWLGLPEQFPSVLDIFKNIGNTFGYIFWRSEVQPWLHLGDLAMLDIFTVAMTALGLYYFEQHHTNLHSRILIFGFFLLLVAVSIAGDQGTYAILMPFIYIFAATGIVTLLSQWNEIFPKNPIARAVAILPLALLMIVTISYHYNRYFVAWPRNPETKQVFISDGELIRQDILTKTNQDSSIIVFSNRSFIPAIAFSTSDIERPSLDIANTASQEISIIDEKDVVYVSRGQRRADIESKLGEPSRFVVSDATNNSVRFWVYEAN